MPSLPYKPWADDIHQAQYNHPNYGPEISALQQRVSVLEKVVQDMANALEAHGNGHAR